MNIHQRLHRRYRALVRRGRYGLLGHWRGYADEPPNLTNCTPAELAEYNEYELQVLREAIAEYKRLYGPLPTPQPPYEFNGEARA